MYMCRYTAGINSQKVSVLLNIVCILTIELGFEGDRERKRDIYIYVRVYMYIHIYIYRYINR